MEKPGRFSKLEVGEAKQEKEVPSDIVEAERGADYYNKLALENYQEGEYESSLRYYSRVLEFDRNELEAWLGQVRSLVELGELKEADIWCNKALERFVDNPQFLSVKAIVHSRMGDFARAKAYCDSSLEKETSSPYLWLARGEVFLASRHRSSEYCFHKGISESPKNWFLHFSIAKIYTYYKKHALACKYFVNAIDLNNSSPFLYFRSARCYEALALYKKASFCYQQALVLKPKYLEAEKSLASLSAQSPLARLFHRR